jgi:hypothetical protein
MICVGLEMLDEYDVVFNEKGETDDAIVGDTPEPTKTPAPTPEEVSIDELSSDLSDSAAILEPQPDRLIDSDSNLSNDSSEDKGNE